MTTAPCLIWIACALFYLGLAFALLLEFCSRSTTWVRGFRCKPFRVAKFCFSLDNRLDIPTLRHRFLLARRLGSKDTPRTFLLDLDFIVTFFLDGFDDPHSGWTKTLR